MRDANLQARPASVRLAHDALHLLVFFLMCSGWLAIFVWSSLPWEEDLEVDEWGFTPETEPEIVEMPEEWRDP